MATLKQRFEAFIQTVDGFEDIDTLLKGRDLPGKTRADYLLHGRTVIVEQKSLEVDPAVRPQNYADKLMARGRLIAFGKVSTTMFSDDLQREFVLRALRLGICLSSRATPQNPPDYHVEDRRPR